MGTRTAAGPAAFALVLLATTAPALTGAPSAAAAPPAAAGAALTWQGSLDVSITVSIPAIPESHSSTWAWTDLTPVDDFGGYTGGVATAGTRVTQEYCGFTGGYVPTTYTWDYVSAAPDPAIYPTFHLVDDGSGGLSLTVLQTGALTEKSWSCEPPSPVILADATGLGRAVDVGTLPDSDPDPLHVVGLTTTTGGTEFSEWTVSVDYDLTAVVCGAQPGDADGDRLPDDYETSYTLSDPALCDTDGDGWFDAAEVASGSSPTSAAQTPDTLPAGTAPSAVSGRGDAGVTCGRTRFAWVTPALDSLGVAKGRRACVFLLSNKVTKGLVATAFDRDRSSISEALMSYLGPHLAEVYGVEALDWAQEASQDASIWSGSYAVAKQAMAKAYNLTRLNAVFTVGQIGALAGVPFVAQWGYKQVRDKDACLQVRVGMNAQGGARLSWSLAYSREHLTDEGLRDQLDRAGVWKKKVRDNRPDTAVKKSVNLSCVAGRVKAGGGEADEVFANALSFVF